MGGGCALPLSILEAQPEPWTLDLGSAALPGGRRAGWLRAAAVSAGGAAP